jgi:hypothetical protein
MNSQDEIRRDRENARRGIMPNIQRRIIMRDEPPVQRASMIRSRCHPLKLKTRKRTMSDTKQAAIESVAGYKQGQAPDAARFGKGTSTREGAQAAQKAAPPTFRRTRQTIAQRRVKNDDAPG